MMRCDGEKFVILFTFFGVVDVRVFRFFFPFVFVLFFSLLILCPSLAFSRSSHRWCAENRVNELVSFSTQHTKLIIHSCTCALKPLWSKWKNKYTNFLPVILILRVEITFFSTPSGTTDAIKATSNSTK